MQHLPRLARRGLEDGETENAASVPYKIFLARIHIKRWRGPRSNRNRHGGPKRFRVEGVDRGGSGPRHITLVCDRRSTAINPMMRNNRNAMNAIRLASAFALMPPADNG
jgi:hypothetical protein